MSVNQAALSARFTEGPRLTTSGLALVAQVEALLAAPPSAERLFGQLTHALTEDTPVSLRLCCARGGIACWRGLERLLTRLGNECRCAGMPAAGIGLTLSMASMEPLLARELRRALLGDGELNLVCDGSQIPAADRRATSLWRQFWQLRDVSSVRTAFWPAVHSRCPLFTSEVATEVLPCSRLQVPTHSAWLLAEVELTDFIEVGGGFDETSLTNSLRDVVDLGEAMHDVCDWPTPAMQQDSWLHRRLAVRLNGAGEVAYRLGLDPEEHESLLVLHRLFRSIGHTVQRRSHQHALSNEVLPGINNRNPCRELPAGSRRRAWEVRWHRAVETSGVRHRNLLVMSPWALLPGADPDPRYMNLLPLMRHVDACCLDRDVSLAGWRASDIRRFHQRAQAVMRSKQAGGLVAQQL